MASLTIIGFDETIKKLEKLSKESTLNDIAKKAVTAALPTLERSVRSHIHPRDVAGNVTTKTAKENPYGVFGVATVSGHDRNGYSAVKRATVLEYGRHDGRGGHAPWRDASASSAESSCKNIMENIVRDEMECD